MHITFYVLVHTQALFLHFGVMGTKGAPTATWKMVHMHTVMFAPSRNNSDLCGCQFLIVVVGDIF